jgi:hypothetical protein
MESTLTDFVRVLRNAEIRVSPAETMDAARALELVGYADRERVRLVLAATLAKTIDDKTLFDECFERFFAWRRPEDADQAQDALPAVMPPRADVAAPGASTAQGAMAGELSELAQLLLSGDAAGLRIAIDAAGRAAGIGDMKVFTQRGLYSRRVLEQLGWPQLQAEILGLEQAPPEPSRVTPRASH